MGPVDGALRARAPRGGRPARAPAHLRRPGADRLRLPLLRRRAARERRPARRTRRPLELTDMRREVDEAMRATTEQLSQVTNLLAMVSAPPIETATIHRVEVLLLQPQVAMVVVITSTGGVTKRVISYDAPLDPGLVDWAASLPQRGAGRDGRGLADAARRSSPTPALDERERAFLETLSPGLHRARGQRGGHAVRGGRRAAALRAPLPGAAPALGPDGGARAPGGAAGGDAGVAVGVERLPAHRRARTRRRSCAR